MRPPPSFLPALAQTYTLPGGLRVSPRGAGHHLAGRWQARSTALAFVENVSEALKTHKGWSVRTGQQQRQVFWSTRQVYGALGLAEGQLDRMFSSLSSTSPSIMLSGQEASPTESLWVLHQSKRHNPALCKLPLKKSQSMGVLKMLRAHSEAAGALMFITAQI